MRFFDQTIKALIVTGGLLMRTRNSRRGVSLAQVIRWPRCFWPSSASN